MRWWRATRFVRRTPACRRADTVAREGGGGEADQGGLEQVAGADRIPALTGVRAVAAMLVMGTHAAYATGLTPRGYPGLLAARMDLGVAVFFVLSGFLLFGPWVRAAVGAGTVSVRRYARNRVRRIMPAYLLTVAAAYAVYEIRPIEPNPGHSWAGLLRNLTLTQIYGDGWAHQGLTQMWSLAVEVAFYAVLPVLARLLLPGRATVGLVVLGAVSPAWVVALHTTGLLPHSAGLWLPHYLVWFVGGMALAVAAVRGGRCYAAVAVPVALVGYLIIATPIAGHVLAPALSLTEDLVRTLGYAAIATLLVAPAALADRGLYTRALACRPMVWLGEISYELFLVHVVVMEVAMTSVLRWPIFTGSAPVLFAVTLALSVPVAWGLHRLTRPRRA
ncbi:acyltransferase [uncultured Mycolicibacterium sp.]|uniref:acyltransferase family protein n=1 Tax=uncultured Mycolicibacterium sp. TaxID=2320817 RepID=UPI00261237C5|nr:acyltransferase [uncultured Mycolicibacterium sp.]